MGREAGRKTFGVQRLKAIKCRQCRGSGRGQVWEEALQKGKKVKGGPEPTDNPSDIQGPVTATATPEAMVREEDEQRNCVCAGTEPQAIPSRP